jgi:ABC-2 type transport system ATP-binding protein
MAIELSGVTKHYGATRALCGIDLRLGEGGIYGLLGPNGAGKTTLVEILEGLCRPTTGSVRVLGLDPVREPRALRERIGIQLQSTAFPPDLTVREVLRLYASFYRARGSVGDVLAQVGLEEKASERIRELSGGQRQRVALATAMVHDPALYLLDEPTAGLDPEARRAIHDIVRDLKRRGRTVLLTSHHLDEIESLADHVLVLRAGRLVADGTPLSLLARSSGESTLWIEVDRPLDPTPLERAGARLEGREGRHLRFVTTDPTSIVLALGEALRSQGVRLLDVRLKRPSLEDVYLELVGAREAA